VKAGKTKPKRTPALKKSAATKAQLEKKYRGAKSDATGLRYEQTVANYFIGKGWNPRHRVSKHGYEYDLYAKKSEILSGDAYLVVECKCKGRVSAKDVVRFINKVDTVYRHLPEILLNKPPLHAYLCYSEAVDEDAAAVAKSHRPSVKLLRIGR
jgi:hypothetical protein